MSLFGDKCARCGTRTKQSYNDVPTCAPCQQEIEVRLKAEHETPRTCPADGETMEKDVAHMIVIDRCPKCHGVWLDAGELEQVSDDIAMHAINAMARSVPYPG